MSHLPTRFRTLDSLRGVAAIVVALFHRDMKDVFSGYLAVDFFLVLSGFVLSHSYLYRERSISVWSFIGKRLARLWPLHVASIFLMYGLYYAIYRQAPFPKHCNLTTFLQNLALVQNIGLPPQIWSWNYPSWSISIEFWINVLFITCITRRTRNSTLLALAALGLGIILWQTGHLNTNYKNYFTFFNSGLIRGLASFFLGILSYRLFLAYRDHGGIRKFANVLELTCIPITLLLLFASKLGYAQWELLAPFLFLFMVPLFAFEHGIVSRLLRPIDYLGTISYSIYLGHLTVFLFLGWKPLREMVPAGLNGPLAILLLLLYSHVTYRCIELPGQRVMRSLFGYMVRSKTDTGP